MHVLMSMHGTVVDFRAYAGDWHVEQFPRDLSSLDLTIIEKVDARCTAASFAEPSNHGDLYSNWCQSLHNWSTCRVGYCQATIILYFTVIRGPSWWVNAANSLGLLLAERMHCQAIFPALQTAASCG